MGPTSVRRSAVSTKYVYVGTKDDREEGVCVELLS